MLFLTFFLILWSFSIEATTLVLDIPSPADRSANVANSNAKIIIFSKG